MTPIFVIPTVLLAITCGAFTFGRLDALFTERTKGIVTSGICLTISFILIIPPVYEAIDRSMPTPNGTDLLSKFFALVSVAFLGNLVNRVFPSSLARRWVAGPQGAVALAGAALAVFACFTFTNAPNPSPLLAAYSDQPSVRIQTWVMLAYIAYVVAPFIVPAFRDSRSNPLKIGRTAALLIALGFLISFLRAFTYPLELTAPTLTSTFQLISDASTLLVVMGLGFWSYTRKKRIVTKELGGSPLSID